MPVVSWSRRHSWAGAAGQRIEAILAQPPDTVRGQIKFTEQGEMLFYRYNNMETAIYELTMGVTGLLKASVSLVKPSPQG